MADGRHPLRRRATGVALLLLAASTVGLAGVEAGAVAVVAVLTLAMLLAGPAEWRK